MKNLLKLLLRVEYKALMLSIDLFVKSIVPAPFAAVAAWSVIRFNEHTVAHLVIAVLSFLGTYLVAAVWLRGGFGQAQPKAARRPRHT